MTIANYIIRALVASGFGIGLMFSLAAGFSILDMKPDRDNFLNGAFCVFLTILVISGYFLWMIK